MTGQIFYYIDRFQEIQGKYKTKNIIKRIDLMLLDITEAVENEQESPEKEKQQINIIGIVLLILSVLLHWGLLGVSIFIK